MAFDLDTQGNICLFKYSLYINNPLQNLQLAIFVRHCCIQKGSGALESRTLPCRLELPVGTNLRSAPALDSDHPRLTTLVRHTIGLATAGKFLLLLKYSLTLSSNVILRWDLAQRKREESLL